MPTIRELRVALGMSQDRLAELIGVSRPAVTRMENGKPVRKSTLLAACRELSTTLDQVEGYKVYDPVAAQNKGKIRR